jgi:hypothetical protein
MPPDLLAGLRVAYQLLDDMDNYEGMDHAIELAKMAYWALGDQGHQR